MAVGSGMDRTFAAIEIGPSYRIVPTIRRAVTTTAAPATGRQRELTSRPVGKSSRTKRNAPLGKTGRMIQFESQAAHCTPGSPGAPRRPRNAYSPEAAWSDPRSAAVRSSQPMGFLRSRVATITPTGRIPS